MTASFALQRGAATGIVLRPWTRWYGNVCRMTGKQADLLQRDIRGHDCTVFVVSMDDSCNVSYPDASKLGKRASKPVTFDFSEILRLLSRSLSGRRGSRDRIWTGHDTSYCKSFIMCNEVQ